MLSCVVIVSRHEVVARGVVVASVSRAEIAVLVVVRRFAKDAYSVTRRVASLVGGGVGERIEVSWAGANHGLVEVR